MKSDPRMTDDMREILHTVEKMCKERKMAALIVISPLESPMKTAILQTQMPPQSGFALCCCMASEPHIARTFLAACMQVKKGNIVEQKSQPLPPEIEH